MEELHHIHREVPAGWALVFNQLADVVNEGRQEQRARGRSPSNMMSLAVALGAVSRDRPTRWTEG